MPFWCVERFKLQPFHIQLFISFCHQFNSKYEKTRHAKSETKRERKRKKWHFSIVRIDTTNIYQQFSSLLLLIITSLHLIKPEERDIFSSSFRWAKWRSHWWIAIAIAPIQWIRNSIAPISISNNLSAKFDTRPQETQDNC